MIEFYGWATIADSTSDSSMDGSQLVFDRIKARLQDLRSSSNVMAIEGWLNGEPRLTFAGAANHRGDFLRALDFFRTIGVEAPGSYGLLIVHDDEDPQHGNEFVTWVLARGRVEPHPDNLLSPVAPTIEDP